MVHFRAFDALLLLWVSKPGSFWTPLQACLLAWVKLGEKFLLCSLVWISLLHSLVPTYVGIKAFLIFNLFSSYIQINFYFTAPPPIRPTSAISINPECDVINKLNPVQIIRIRLNTTLVALFGRKVWFLQSLNQTTSRVWEKWADRKIVYSKSALSWKQIDNTGSFTTLQFLDKWLINVAI